MTVCLFRPVGEKIKNKKQKTQRIQHISSRYIKAVRESFGRYPGVNMGKRFELSFMIKKYLFP